MNQRAPELVKREFGFQAKAATGITDSRFCQNLKINAKELCRRTS